MKLITIALPQVYLDGLERLISEDVYPNRSEAVRIAVRDFLRSEEGQEQARTSSIFLNRREIQNDFMQLE